MSKPQINYEKLGSAYPTDKNQNISINVEEFKFLIESYAKTRVNTVKADKAVEIRNKVIELKDEINNFIDQGNYSLAIDTHKLYIARTAFEEKLDSFITPK